jgi:hypothetical protein
MSRGHVAFHLTLFDVSLLSALCSLCMGMGMGMGSCPHGFTDPLEGHGKYVEQAANQSHTSMRAFYAQQLGLQWTC